MITRISALFIKTSISIITETKLRLGMALVIVLVLSMALLILGSAYMKTVSHTTVFNPIQLKKLQADFLAQGIAEIALLKFRKFQADFYHSYFAYIAGPPASSAPYIVFREQGSGPEANKPLRNYKISGKSICDPVKITDYTVDYHLISNKGFDKDGLVINVAITLDSEGLASSTNLTFVSSFTYEITRTLVRN